MELEELKKLMEMDATPIDFDALIASGVIEKKGAWYQIHKWQELPEHAKRKIREVQQTTGKPGLVKFRPATKPR